MYIHIHTYNIQLQHSHCYIHVNHACSTPTISTPSLFNTLHSHHRPLHPRYLTLVYHECSTPTIFTPLLRSHYFTPLLRSHSLIKRNGVFQTRTKSTLHNSDSKGDERSISGREQRAAPHVAIAFRCSSAATHCNITSTHYNREQRATHTNTAPALLRVLFSPITRALVRALSHPLSRAVSLTRACARALSISYPLTLTLPLARALSLSRAFSHALSLSLSLALPRARTQKHTH